MNTGNLQANQPDAPPAIAASLASRTWRVLTFGGRLGRRAAIVLWLVAAIVASITAGWSWIVAAGLSGLVLGLLPCLAMCAAGLCGGGSRKDGQ